MTKPRVLFLSPHYPPEMVEFTAALAHVGAEVYAVGESPREMLPVKTRRALSGYVRVRSLLREDLLLADTKEAILELRPDAIETLWEPCVVAAAKMRDAAGLDGMNAATVRAFRDKTLMKKKVREAGIRAPRDVRATSPDDVYRAADELGLPLIFKPVAGAGTSNTFPIRDKDALDYAASLISRVGIASVEELVDVAAEFTYDTVCVEGRPVFESVAQYHPPPIESRRKEWISPAQLVFANPHEHPIAKRGIEVGRDVLAALGMGTGFTHMEWFLTPDDEVVFGEIAARSPGGRLVDQMNYANDFDVFVAWAEAVTKGRVEQKPSRRLNVATVFKRAQGAGRISGSEGIDEMRRRCGEHILAEEWLPYGARRRDWRATLLSDGHITVGHQNYASCVEMMWWAVRHVRLFANG